MLTKADHLRDAVANLDQAMLKLQRAKVSLSHARSELVVRLAVALGEIEDIHAILTDPECTPELGEVIE